MKTLVTALVAAAMLAVAAPAPARANDAEAVATIVAGLLTIGLIAKAVEDRRDERQAVETTRNASGLTPLGNGTWGRIDNSTPRGRIGAARLPERCLRRVETARGYRDAFGSRCLARNYAHAGLLPDSCRRRVDTDRGVRTVYGAHCLRRNGFLVEAGRRD